MSKIWVILICALLAACICSLSGCATRKELHRSQKASAIDTEIKQSSKQDMTAWMQDSTFSYEVVRVEYFAPQIDSTGAVVKGAIKAITTTKAIQKAVTKSKQVTQIDTLRAIQKSSTTEHTQHKEVKQTGLPWWVWLVGGLLVAGCVAWRVYFRR